MKNETAIGLFLTSVVAIAAAILLFGCATVPNPVSPGPSPNTNFKFDLVGDVNGTPFDGIGVIPAAKSFTLTVTSPVDVDLLTIDTCHRSFSVESAITSGWFRPRRGYVYTFIPAHGIEDLGTCLLRIGAYNKSGQPQAWALIDFLTPESTLPATNWCDGDHGTTHGVSMCQSRAGLDEQIVFDVPVMMSTMVDPRCAIKIPKDGKTWFYTLASGECIFYWMEIAPPHRFHRHTTIGYQSVQIRGAQ